MSRSRLVIDAARMAPGVDIKDEDSDDSIRRRAVTAVMGEQWTLGRPDQYIEGLFDTCVRDGRTAPALPILPAGRARHH